jgi:hypothetical protein
MKNEEIRGKQSTGQNATAQKSAQKVVEQKWTTHKKKNWRVAIWVDAHFLADCCNWANNPLILFEQLQK